MNIFVSRNENSFKAIYICEWKGGYPPPRHLFSGNATVKVETSSSNFDDKGKKLDVEAHLITDLRKAIETQPKRNIIVHVRALTRII